jgi:DNA-binding NarL/FixJ family response regulator
MAAPRTDNVPVTSPPNPPRVLVVDDVDGSRDLIREILESEGIDVVGEAENGETAIQLALELHPDVVLMDVRMKGMDGIEATRRLKELLPSVHVIILSVFDDTSLLKEAVKAGASAHVTKGSAACRLSAQIFSVCGMTTANA